MVNNHLGLAAEIGEIGGMDSLIGTLACAGVALSSARLQTSVDDRVEVPLGVLARRIFAMQLRSPYRQVHSHARKNLRVRFNLVNRLSRAWTFARRHAGTVQRARGLSLWHQALQLLRLAFVYRVDPATYYAHQLYDAPAGIAEVEHYLGRYEMKSGLYSLLRELRRADPNFDLSLSEKAVFSEACRRAGLPHAVILAIAERGAWSYRDPDPHAFDRGLFVKSARGRGAAGAHGYRFESADRYRAPDGAILSIKALLDGVARSSADRAMLVMPKLENHPEIADLAEQSLITFRVFTSLDATGQPVVTHAMLRALSKLEPSWHTDEEFAAALDIETGRLGPMCGDDNLAPDAWWDRHPKTGAPVTGRVISNWPAIAAVARDAHRAFSGRMIIGWDLALATEGVFVIEGNSDADTHFLQRVHRQMIGHSPLAPLLRHHLSAAEALLTRSTSPSAS